ncbi:helix-turn-helix domain-containing protein [Siphonobacter aquaeclarae]|jgi:transcriptional regulator with XRE-family HTH domain|uniref:Transcriptional regulator, XRE family with cupin sensor n=1 Tax=Siphonobacter aquaeclarae TaxID=563176 RepID=A0A1G9UCI9_9BACT|nr:helix-turn-helix domain-containing protein [Siphonobacter aquaeclarae]SDM57582.1 transcriptional regulator, XRE family with cupin sensor [Siphonobacter aquaeclarae]
MQEDILLQISSRLRETRKSQGITLQELANRAEVSKALISQIENNRTIPSLLVLINLIRSLGVDLNVFFEELANGAGNSRVLLRRSDEYQTFYKEDVREFAYRRILTKTVGGVPMDVVLLELQPRARRNKPIKTEAFEFKFLIRGEVEYIIGDEVHHLREGDSLFFDGRIPHRPANLTDSDALMLVFYFFVDKA